MQSPIIKTVQQWAEHAKEEGAGEEKIAVIHW